MLETQKKCNERREVTMEENEEYSRELIEIVRGNVKSFIGSPLRLQKLSHRNCSSFCLDLRLRLR